MIPSVLVAATNQTNSSAAVTPADDPRNILGYKPSNVLTTIAFLLYLLTTLIHTWRLWKFGGKYMLATIIGGYFYAFGLIMRYVVRNNPDSIGIYIAMNTPITLSPCGFIASTYMLLGRLAVWLQCPHHLLVRANRVTIIFVMSDVFTFLIQGSGGGLAASSSSSSQKLGSHVFLGGLILQLISFLFFTVIFLHFLNRVRTREPATWNKSARQGRMQDWRTLAYAIAFSCLGILIRSFYRVIELSQGFKGHLSTTEGYFYGLDALPLWLAISVYVLIWPAKFIPDGLNLRANTEYGNAQTIDMETVVHDPWHPK